MKTIRNTIFLFAVATSLSQAQFTSGSDGSYGPLDVTANTTLVMPPDGIFHCTTINITAGRTLSFTKNANNTPVYLLATGDITISGTINVNGQNASFGNSGAAGGPGGFDGGNKRRSGISEASDGFGPGGGIIGVGSGHGTNLGSPLLIPLVGGGGGAANTSVNGSGGGGALLLASSTKVRLIGNGLINAFGGVNGSTGYGGGGAVRIVAPDLEGNGRMTVGIIPATSGIVRIDSFGLANQTFRISQGRTTYGANMIVFPPDLPNLEIFEVGGVPVDPDAMGPVTVDVGEGAPAEQTVKVRATNFTGDVEVVVVVVPESGDSSQVDFTIVNPGPDPAEGTATVTVPANTVSRLYVWTKPAS